MHDGIAIWLFLDFIYRSKSIWKGVEKYQSSAEYNLGVGKKIIKIFCIIRVFTLLFKVELGVILL